MIIVTRVVSKPLRINALVAFKGPRIGLAPEMSYRMFATSSAQSILSIVISAPSVVTVDVEGVVFSAKTPGIAGGLFFLYFLKTRRMGEAGGYRGWARASVAMTSAIFSCSTDSSSATKIRN